MPEAPEKKKRSPIERMIVWGLIAAMLVVVVIEYLASKNFNATQDYLTKAVETQPTPTLDEMKSKISGASIGPKQKDKLGTDEYELTFFSLFKSEAYKLRVQMLTVPEGGAELAEGERRIAEVYAPHIVESVRKEHEQAIKTKPDLPDAGNGTGSGSVGEDHDSEGGNAVDDEPSGEGAADADPEREQRPPVEEE